MPTQKTAAPAIRIVSIFLSLSLACLLLFSTDAISQTTAAPTASFGNLAPYKKGVTTTCDKILANPKLNATGGAAVTSFSFSLLPKREGHVWPYQSRGCTAD